MILPVPVRDCPLSSGAYTRSLSHLTRLITFFWVECPSQRDFCEDEGWLSSPGNEHECPRQAPGAPARAAWIPLK